MWGKISSLLRPRHGWLVWVLLLGTVLCLPLGLAESRWLIGSSALVGVVLLAAWLGYALGQTPLPGWLVGLYGLLTGIEWNLAVLGRLLPGWRAVAGELAHAARWLADGLRGTWSADLPFVSLVPEVEARGLALWQRLDAWFRAGVAGTVSRDSLVLLLFAAVAAWWISYFAGWQLARGRSALLALSPLGSALLANVALTGGAGVNYLRTFLGCALLLLVFSSYEGRELAWDREGIDYSPDLRAGVRLVGTGLATMIVVAALLVPYITVQETVNFFWRYAYEPWTEVSRRLDRLFAGRNPVPPSRHSGPTRPNPEGHQLGGEVQQRQDLVFYVTTSDPPPEPPEAVLARGEMPEVPKHYWRTLTYDTYTGRGWLNGPHEELVRAADDPVATSEFPHTVLTQTYTLREAWDDLVPAANEPILVDRTYTLSRRAPNDLVGFGVASRTYTVTSRIPAPTIVQLRGAGEEYPPEIAERYLPLPEVPQRVLDLAAELVATAQTPYDKALAIEQHFRHYDYDLEISAPPEGHDVVDYLLFVTRRGYCDYYATAMVVMLRAVGVPARYAAGYATGYYDYNRRAYVIAERDAHAWVEVYFPGYGWVEFEPTPYRTAFARPAGGELPMWPTPEPQDALPSEGGRAMGALLVVAVAVVALGGFFWGVLTLIRARRTFSAGRLAVQIYARMVRWAERSRLGPERGETPREFGA
ncbi:MAG: transglutaminase domain-containing protein, partial [Anaerolineae bacterium]|nr:transglutaminase domain-containing protein [Anaerolineae bacterium]